MKTLLTILFMSISMVMTAQDTIQTDKGSFTIHFVGHGSLYIEHQGQVIHIDPWTKVGDYPKLPDADFILITHAHRDHLDTNAINEIVKKSTVIIAPKVCQANLSGFDGAKYLGNDEVYAPLFDGLKAVPAYNIKHSREPGKPFHPKGEGNGYVVTIDGTRVYIAGDTENIPEMSALKGVDIAFLPMNLPYTMTPVMAADAAKMIEPGILYPYHFGKTNTQELIDLLKDTDIEIRIRAME